MRRLVLIEFVMVTLVLGIAVRAVPAHAGPFDKLKKKAEDKATQKSEEAIDQAAGEQGEPSKEAPTEEEAGASTSSKGGTEGSGAGGQVSSVSTKFDYVPGDSVLFLDDFTQDELGEFPSRWRLRSGTFETAEMNGERWMRCTSDDGHVRMKVPPSLPEFWTLEFETYGVDVGAYLGVSAVTDQDHTVWETMFPHSGTNLSFRCGDIFSSTKLEGAAVKGRHHVMVMARGTALKVYVDRERLANVPDVTGPGTPAELDIRLWAPGMSVKPMITNVRWAEGCRPAKDMLAEGKLVTYGIHFDSGSDVVRPESAPVLRQIAAYLESKPDVKLRITGHTDNVGKPDANLDLSKRRAASVAAVLSSQFRIGADRFQTAGSGDTQPLSSNAKPEGRAMNRRVEFTRLDPAAHGTATRSSAR